MLTRFRATIRSSRRVLASALVAGALAAPAVASAQVVNFESLGYGPACQWGGGTAFSSYAGMSWSGLRPLDLGNFSTACGRSTNSGYSALQAAYVGNVIALGAGAAWVSSSTPFVLSSLVAGAGWLNPTKLTLDFYLGGVLKGTSALSLNVTQTGATPFSGASLYSGATDFVMFTPDYSAGVDVFNSAAESCAGVPLPCTPTSYKSWFVDNLKFTEPTVNIQVTPEPSTMALFGAGLVAMGAWARRRRRRA